VINQERIKIERQVYFTRRLSCRHWLPPLNGCVLLAIACQETGTAVHRASLRWVERHRRLLATLRTLHGDFNSLPDSGSLRGRDGCEPFILGLLARFAALGLVLQPFIVKEDLFARCPDEIVSTVDAFYRAVFEFCFRMTPFPV
jgi:hypothetical protein